MKASPVFNHWKVALWFLLPNITGFFLFTFGPVLATLLISFTQWDLLGTPRYVGLSNYTELLSFHDTPTGWEASDPEFWQYLGNTLFMMLSIPINVLGSLGVALMLDRKIKFAITYRFIFFLPSVLSSIGIYYLWRWIYNPDYGLLNQAIEYIGFPGPNWLSDPLFAKPAIMLMGFWLTIGGSNMVLYLAALKSVPQTLYDLAAIEGANPWQRFWAVTWPSIRPVTFFILVTNVIAGMKGGFEAAYAITGGGPLGATTTLEYYIYNNAYHYFRMGYAATIAWILFLIILAISIINWKFGSKKLLAH